MLYRKGVIEDTEQILVLGRQMHKESAFADLDWSDSKAANLFKTCVSNPNYCCFVVEKNGFLVDNESDRKIGELFKGSDLVIADYGGSIFSSIYMLKPTLLLNLPKNTEYVINKIFNKTFDIQLRNKIISLNLHDKKKDFIFTIEKLLTKNEANKIKKVKNYFFGKKNNKNQILKTRKYLLDLLKK